MIEGRSLSPKYESTLVSRIQPFVNSLRFNTSKAKVFLLATDSSGRNEYVGNSIFIPIFIFLIGVVSLLSIYLWKRFRCCCGSLITFGKNIEIEGNDDTEIKDEREIVTIAINEEYAVRGTLPYKKQFGYLTERMKNIRMIFVCISFVALIISLVGVIKLSFLHSSYRSVLSKLSSVSDDISMAIHSTNELVNDVSVIQPLRQNIITTIGSTHEDEGVQTCIDTKLLKDSAEETWNSLMRIGGYDMYEEEFSELLFTLSDARDTVLDLFSGSKSFYAYFWFASLSLFFTNILVLVLLTGSLSAWSGRIKLYHNLLFKRVFYPAFIFTVMTIWTSNALLGFWIAMVVDFCRGSIDDMGERNPTAAILEIIDAKGFGYGTNLYETSAIYLKGCNGTDSLYFIKQFITSLYKASVNTETFQLFVPEDSENWCPPLHPLSKDIDSFNEVAFRMMTSTEVTLQHLHCEKVYSQYIQPSIDETCDNILTYLTSSFVMMMILAFISIVMISMNCVWKSDLDIFFDSIKESVDGDDQVMGKFQVEKLKTKQLIDKKELWSMLIQHSKKKQMPDMNAIRTDNTKNMEL